MVNRDAREDWLLFAANRLRAEKSGCGFSQKYVTNGEKNQPADSMWGYFE